ncbi:transposable element Tcb1 transposase [Trichonephila clavipes]|nr:transposable element Tcb1 transposase [Trichonephila clavipes]
MRSLHPYVRPYAAAIGNDFILMDDNARPHRARIVEEDHGLERMKWPARSPDLNPIEHLWDYLGREVAALNPPPRSLHELKQGLLCVWSSLPIPVSDNLINSMGNRCRQCIQSVISRRLWQRFQDDGNVSRCYSTGRPRFTTPNEDRYLAVTAKRNRRSTASNLSCQLSSATGTTVSRQTVYRRLEHIGLYARRPVRCVPLTATRCRLRLTWSREHALWTPQQWSCVVISDYSSSSLQSDSCRNLIWTAPGTRYHQENTIERIRYGGAGWLVWEGIILGSRTDLHVQSVTMTGHIYRDVILEQHVRLFSGRHGC